MKRNKAISFIIALVLAFTSMCVSGAAFAQDGYDIKVLFVGNSFTYTNSLPDLYEGLSDTAGLKVRADSITYGSAYLSYYADKNHAYGEELRDMLKDEDYDYVVVQPQSLELLKTYATTTLSSANTIVNLIRKYGAEPILFMTWGYRDGCSYALNGEDIELDRESMTQTIADYAYSLGNELGITVAPCGYNLLRYTKQNSDKSMYKSDGKHPSYLASYISMCTIYNTIISEYNIKAEEKRGTCLGVPFWYTEDEDGYPVIDISVKQEYAELAQQISDIRMTCSVSGISANKGTKAKISAEVKASDDNALYGELFDEEDKITLVSLDEKIASADSENGIVYLKNAGNTVVRAVSDSGVSLSVPVESRQPATSVTLSTDSVELDIGDTKKLDATVKPANATDKSVSWTSSNTDVATVSDTGKIKAVSSGKCKITVTSHNGYTDVCTVYVRLTTPKNVKVKNQTSSKGSKYSNFKITWDEVNGASKYLVYRSTSKSGGYTQIKEVSGTECTDKNQKRGVRYYYKVYASNGTRVLRSAASSYASGKVPAKVRITEGRRTESSGKKHIKITWAKQSDVAGYEVYRSTKKNGKYKLVKRTGSNTFTDSNVRKKKTYYYRVKAYVKIDGNTIFGKLSSRKRVKKAK